MSVATASRAVLRAGVIACLFLAALAFAVHASEYPLTTRAGLRVHASEVLSLLGLGALNLVALNATPRGTLRPTFVGLAVGNALLTAGAFQLLRPGAALFPWLLAGVGTLLVIGSVGCAVSPRAVPREYESFFDAPGSDPRPSERTATAVKPP